MIDSINHDPIILDNDPNRDPTKPLLMGFERQPQTKKQKTLKINPESQAIKKGKSVIRTHINSKVCKKLFP